MMEYIHNFSTNDCDWLQIHHHVIFTLKFARVYKLHKIMSTRSNQENQVQNIFNTPPANKEVVYS